MSGIDEQQPEIKLLQAPKMEDETELLLRARGIFIEKGVIGPFFSEDRRGKSRSQDEIDFYNFYCETRKKYIKALSQNSTLLGKNHLEAKNIGDWVCMQIIGLELSR